jgi:DNA primase
MTYTREQIEQCKANLNMLDLLNQLGLSPNSAGKVKCWLHDEREPSMQIYDKHYHCFGCGAKGDVLHLYQHIYNIDKFYDVLEKLLGAPDSREQNEGEIFLRNKHVSIACSNRYQVCCERKSIIFSIQQSQHKIIRYLNVDAKSKYHYSPGFVKSRELYPATVLRQAVALGKKLYVTEGPTDALRLLSIGRSAVAILGCTASNHQLQMLSLAPQICLMLDGDQAGDMGAYRICEHFLKQKHRYNITVCVLPDGKDPCDLTKKEIESVPVLSYSHFMCRVRAKYCDKFNINKYDKDAVIAPVIDIMRRDKKWMREELLL